MGKFGVHWEEGRVGGEDGEAGRGGGEGKVG